MPRASIDTPRPPIAILIAATGLGPLALNMLVPSLPGLERVFATDYATAQLALTSYLIGFAVAQLFYGPLSDRYGRRPVLLAGLVTFLLGSGLCLIAPGIEWLIAGRLVQAVGGCAGLVMGRAIVRDLFDRDRAASVLAYVTMSMVIAPMLAPTLGGHLEAWVGWWAGFAFVIVYAAGLLLAAHHALAESHRERREVALVPTIAGMMGLLGQRAFLGYALQAAASSSVFFAFLGGAPYVMVNLLERPPAEFGLYFLFVSAMYMAGNFLAGRFSARVGVDRMILVGCTVTLIGPLGLVFSLGVLSPVVLFGCVGAVALGNGMSLPNAIAASVSVDPARAGAAAGIGGFLQMAAAAATSLAAGALLADSARPMVAVMATSALVALLAHLSTAGTKSRFSE